MNKSIGLAALAILLFAVGCKDQNFKKTKKSGIEYKSSGGNGNPVKYGNAIKFQAFQYYNDSLMSNPFDTVAQVIEIDSTKLPADYIEIFTSARNGDSVFTRTPTDSIAKFNPLPPYAKKGPGQYFGYHFKILDIITDPAKVAAVRSASMESMRRIDSVSMVKQKAVDDSTLSTYLTKNNIKATKTAKGTYVEIINPGTGDSINNGKAITVDREERHGREDAGLHRLAQDERRLLHPGSGDRRPYQGIGHQGRRAHAHRRAGSRRSASRSPWSACTTRSSASLRSPPRRSPCSIRPSRRSCRSS